MSAVQRFGSTEAPGDGKSGQVLWFQSAGWRRFVVVGKDSYRRRVEIVELTGADRPHENSGDRDDGDDGDPDEERKDLHAGQRPGSFGVRLRRSALPATASELRDMPIAAAQGGTTPEAASGSATRL